MTPSPTGTCAGDAVGIIPARLASVRFPRKMLASDTGMPLVQHVVERALQAKSLSRVVVATDAEEIAKACEGFGATVVMTSSDHPNGTSRLAEAADKLGLADDAIAVNAQGDEPEMEPSVIDAAVDALRTAPANVPASTVASPFAPDDDVTSPDIVKVVRSVDGRALYFSRAPIPADRDGDAAQQLGEGAQALKHIGIYCYRRAFLKTYAALAPTPLEQSERLEQLRILEHGYAIMVAIHPSRSCGIDTPQQYAAFVARWKTSHSALTGKGN